MKKKENEKQKKNSYISAGPFVCLFVRKKTQVFISDFPFKGKRERQNILVSSSIQIQRIF